MPYRLIVAALAALASLCPADALAAGWAPAIDVGPAVRAGLGGVQPVGAVIDAPGDAVVGWENGYAKTVRIAQRPAGGTFSEPRTLASPATSLRLTKGPSAATTAAWLEHPASGWVIRVA